MMYCAASLVVKIFVARVRHEDVGGVLDVVSGVAADELLEMNDLADLFLSPLLFLAMYHQEP